MNIEQARAGLAEWRAHYDSEIDYKRRKAAGLIKDLKGLLDRADIYFASPPLAMNGLRMDVTCRGDINGVAASISQFAVQLQEAAADCRRCEELKNQLGEFLNNEVAV